MNPRKPARSATQDELLPARSAVAREEPWRVLRILGDFVEGFETLAGLARAGYAVITGGGPGILEAASCGAPGDLTLLRTADTVEAVVAHVQRRHSRAGGSRGPGK